MIFKTEKHTYKIKYSRGLQFKKHYLTLWVSTNDIDREWADTGKFHCYNSEEEMNKVVVKTDDEIKELFKAYVEEFENEEKLLAVIEKRFNS